MASKPHRPFPGRKGIRVNGATLGSLSLHHCLGEREVKGVSLGAPSRCWAMEWNPWAMCSSVARATASSSPWRNALSSSRCSRELASARPSELSVRSQGKARHMTSMRLVSAGLYLDPDNATPHCERPKHGWTGALVPTSTPVLGTPVSTHTSRCRWARLAWLSRFQKSRLLDDPGRKAKDSFSIRYLITASVTSPETRIPCRMLLFHRVSSGSRLSLCC